MTNTEGAASLSLLFTTQDHTSDSAKLCFSRVDVTSGAQRTTVEAKNTVLLNHSTEKITAIDNKYGDGIWLTDFLWSPSFVSYTCNTGRVRVGICREGGDRIFDGTNSLLLASNSPNPFNASTLIGFTLIERGRTGLYVLDVLGRRVATLVDAFMEPGYHERIFDASSYPSGMYYYVLMTPNQSVVRIMTVLK